MTTNQRSKSMTTASASGTETARRIADLINSKSTTPSVVEIDRILAAQVSQTEQTVTISALADELARSFELEGAMERGKDAAGTVFNLKYGKDEEGSSAANRLSRDYEAIENEVCIRREALEQAILSSEPHTASDVLSLLVVTVSELDAYVHSYCDFDTNDGALGEWIKLERATRAVVRGLVNICGTDSALLKTHFVKRHLPPREQLRERLLEQRPTITAERTALENNGRRT
jgi:hypothetical protein